MIYQNSTSYNARLSVSGIIHRIEIYNRELNYKAFKCRIIRECLVCSNIIFFLFTKIHTGYSKFLLFQYLRMNYRFKKITLFYCIDFR